MLRRSDVVCTGRPENGKHRIDRHVIIYRWWLNMLHKQIPVSRPPPHLIHFISISGQKIFTIYYATLFMYVRHVRNVAKSFFSIPFYGAAELNTN